MVSDAMRTSRVVALVLVVGIFFTAQEVSMDLARGHSVDTLRDIWNGLEFWAVWGVLTPVVLVAARRWPLEAKPAYRPLFAHATIAITLATVHNLITTGLQAVALSLWSTGGVLREAAAPRAAVAPVRCEVQLPGLSGGFHTVWSAPCSRLAAFVWGLFAGLVLYAVIVMVSTALRYRSSASALETELTQSKLDTLRSQLRPHFLFNTLNTISVFMTEDAAKAQQMLLRLSTLLRRSLDEEAHEISFRQELAFASDYLYIQRWRFGEQLTVTLAVDPRVMNARVPVFLLQPLLENAFEHGTSGDRRTAIGLRARRELDVLHIAVEDDGSGIEGGAPAREGVGLRNTRARLRHLYGAGATVALAPQGDSADAPGTKVDVRLPFQEMSA